MQETTGSAVRKKFSFDTAAVWAASITAALAAILIIPGDSVPVVHTKVSFLILGVLAALALYILARLTRGNVIVPPLLILGAAWLVPLAYALSMLFSGVPAERSFFGINFELDTFGLVLALMLLATVTALAFRRAGEYRVFFLVYAVVYALLVLSTLGVIAVSRFSPGSVSPLFNLAGSFADLGMLAGLGVAFSLLALRFLTVSRQVRTALYAAVVLGLFCVALVNSTLIFTLVSLIALALFIEAVMRRKANGSDDELEGVATLPVESVSETSRGGTTIVMPLITLVISLFFIIGGSTLGTAFVNAMGTGFIDARPSWQATFAVGGHTYASSPLFGTGPGTFGTKWLEFRDRSINDTPFWSVDFVAGVGHIPTSFITTGALGALAWILFIGLFLFIGIRALLMRPPVDPFLRFVSIASFSGALYVILLAIFALPGAAVLAVGYLCLGIFVSSLRHGNTRQEWGIIFSKSPRVGFVVVFFLTLLLLASVLAAYVVIGRYLSARAFGEANTRIGNGDIGGALAAADQSILFAPTDRAYQLKASAGTVRMNQIANDATLAPSTAQQEFQNALSGSVDAALTATRLNPANYQNWVVLGSVYQTVVPLQIDGAYDNAKAAYERAIALNPSNPALPYVLAQLEIASGNAARGEELLLQSIGLKRDYTQAIFLLSQLKVGQGKAREALEAAEAAAYFAPNDPVVLFQVGILRASVGDVSGATAALSRAIEINAQYANAHFFLGVMYSISGQFDRALTELEIVAAFSAENEAAVRADIETLRGGKNPFPPSRLSTLGIPQAPVEEPSSVTP